jgi:hypothetical protein
MKKNYSDLEDNLQEKYDLGNSEVGKLGSEHKRLSGQEVSNEIEYEIDVLISFFENHFVSKRNKYQDRIIFLTRKWKSYQKYFSLAAIAFFVISFLILWIAIRASVELSRNNKIQDFQFIGTILIYSFLFCFLIAAIFMCLFVFASSIDALIDIYQDKLLNIGKKIKKNINKNKYFRNRIEKKKINKITILLLRNQFENRIKTIENHLKFIEPISYITSILWILLNIYIRPFKATKLFFSRFKILFISFKLFYFHNNFCSICL